MKTFLMTILLVGLAGAASAQSKFTLTAAVFDSGGQRSTGAVHVVSGSLGQPAGGQLRSASFQLAGGYYGMVAVVSGEPGPGPTLRLVPTPREVLLAWPAATARSFQLEQTPRLTLPEWTAVTAAPQRIGDEYQVRLPWQAGDRFFRLRQP